MNKESNSVSKRARLIKIGIDMDLRNYRVVRQIDHSDPQRVGDRTEGDGPVLLTQFA